MQELIWKPFVEVVDELGGIEYNVPFDLNEPNTEDKGRIKVKKGKRNLSGDRSACRCSFKKTRFRFRTW
ncbi:LCP family protein [Mammaliicoccus sciuri]|nr:LCP family protein [Mammaliicoccus sciuri]